MQRSLNSSLLLISSHCASFFLNVAWLDKFTECGELPEGYLAMELPSYGAVGSSALRMRFPGTEAASGCHTLLELTHELQTQTQDP